MISIYKTNSIKTSEEGETLYGELRGKSTDTKPNDKFEGKIIGNGCVYIEIDTGKFFFFDGDSKTWKEA